jgi:predicted ATP-binding protein involved in virulence
MTKVQKIFVRNLRQIDEMTTTFNGCTAIVTGGNNKGKSTLLKSIVERLRGDKTNIVKE